MEKVLKSNAVNKKYLEKFEMEIRLELCADLSEVIFHDKIIMDSVWWHENSFR